MKRIGALFLAVWMLFMLAGCSRVRIPSGAEGKVVYHYDGCEVSFSEELTGEELETVISILDGKGRISTLTYGMPSCGFSPEIGFVIDGTTYMMARDTCETLMICGTFDYIDVSPEEQDILEAVFTSRGGEFPCI